AMRKRRDQEFAPWGTKGRDSTGKRAPETSPCRPRRLLAPADAELLLHRLEDGPDLLHRPADLVFRHLQGPRPVLERLRIRGVDLRHVGRDVPRARIALVGGGHSPLTASAPDCSRSQRSRPASWNAFCTGERMYSSTERVPRWISLATCMPGCSG